MMSSSIEPTSSEGSFVIDWDRLSRGVATGVKCGDGSPAEPDVRFPSKGDPGEAERDDPRDKGPKGSGDVPSRGVTVGIAGTWFD